MFMKFVRDDVERRFRRASRAEARSGRASNLDAMGRRAGRLLRHGYWALLESDKDGCWVLMNHDVF